MGLFNWIGKIFQIFGLGAKPYPKMWGPVSTFSPLSRPNKATSTLDMVMRTSENNNIAMATLSNKLSDDTLVFRGAVFEPAISHLRSVKTNFSISIKELQKIKLKQISDSEFIVLDLNGVESDYKVENFSSKRSDDGRYRFFSGSVIDKKKNRKIDVVLTDDPTGVEEVACVVIIVGLALVAGCALIIVVQSAVSQCEKELKDAIELCIEKGKTATFDHDCTFFLDYDAQNGLQGGCSCKCRLTCE